MWSCAEPWLERVATVAQDPSVLLAEVGPWAALCDRYSSARAQESDGGSRLEWNNDPGVPADPRECEFRLGALDALLHLVSGGETVSIEHVSCRGRGDEHCLYVVDDWFPCRDVAHERLLRETARLASQQARTEPLLRRLLDEASQARSLPELGDGQSAREFMAEVEDIIMIFDRELILLDANPAAERLHGMALGEMIGQSARELMSDASYRAIRASLPVLFEVGALRGARIEARTRDGFATIEVSARVSGNGETVVCIARDITSRLRLEHELSERNRELSQRSERIAESDRLKSEFLANVSHELTTPLTSIRGFARLLRRDLEAENGADPGDAAPRLSSEQRREFLAIVDNEARRMNDLISGLMELSQIESGTVKLDRRPADLSRIAADSAALLGPRMSDEGRELRLELADLPSIPLDVDRVKQIVLNLLDNALKFSPRRSPIRLQTRAAENGCELRVSNRSSDLNEADLERIFARFVQKDGSFSRPRGGVGIGLDLVRALASLHGGSAHAELRSPGEVEFTVRFPLT